MKFPRSQREELSVNLTPLIDVVFLLLIFFMITTTFTRETQLQVTLPEADSAEAAESVQQRIDVTVSADGVYSVNDQVLINTQALTLRRAVEKIAGDSRELPFIITADAMAPHQAVVTAMDVAGQLGFSRLSITTQQQAEFEANP
ncbi:ExbD/TolR family protein [Nitrincola tapanii]|uniref:Biopolymer transporter ExbD n=1 Tax=Nitrincola tapanii TaxID=1708751 RepID=A0A5A9W5I2_9GAMM|nr:biopolymer transporter ExbD [Nitrincola tapanii]KAA0875339.1 biopolymer transporter ExbD [Nitrincola tapanii]